MVTTTRLSSKGQVIIPKEVRDGRGWKAGDELVVEERPEGVMLKRAKPFVATTVDDVSGCLKSYYAGPARSVEEMSAAVDEVVRSQWRSFRRAPGKSKPGAKR